MGLVLPSSTASLTPRLRLFFFVLWVRLGMGQMQGHGSAKVLYKFCSFNSFIPLIPRPRLVSLETA